MNDDIKSLINFITVAAATSKLYNKCIAFSYFYYSSSLTELLGKITDIRRE